MDGYQELKLIGSEKNQDNLLRHIIENLPKGWTYRQDISAESLKLYRLQTFCFSAVDLESEAEAIIWFHKGEDKFYRVSTVRWASKKEAPSVIQQNTFVSRFYSEVLKSTAQQFDVRANITASDVSPEVMMSSDLLKRFRTWKGKAGKTTSYEREARNAFIIQAHKEKSLVSAGLIQQYMKEALDTDEAEILAVAYEQGRDLLEKYDAEQP